MDKQLSLTFQEGTPREEGWYAVILKPGHIDGNKKYDVDYCRRSSASDKAPDCNYEWAHWYRHNISHYAELPMGGHYHE